MQILKFIISFLIINYLLLADANAATCSVSTTPVSFGNYITTSSSDKTTLATLSISCSGLLVALTYSVDFAGGSSGNANNRYMLSGTNKLYYNIYKDVAYSSKLGNASLGGVYALSVLHPISYNIYGKIPALQNAVPGSYSDNVTVTINW